MSRHSKASRPGPVSAVEISSGPPPSYLSARSRSSVSEASKAIDSGLTGSRGRPGWVTSEKEERELAKGRTTSTRLSNISRSTSAYVPPTQHAPAPSRSHLPTPDRSSPLKATERLTLRPPGTRSLAIPEAGETSQQDSTIKPIRPSTKLHVPKQKIKPLVSDPNQSKNSKKKGFVTPAPVVPPRLAEPEVGTWEGDEWVEGTVAEITKGEGEETVEAEGLDKQLEDLSSTRAAHCRTHGIPSPASCPQPVPAQSSNSQSVTVARYPRQIDGPLPKQVEPLFAPGYEEEVESVAQIHARYDSSAQPIDPISRSSTRRDYHLSPDSTASEPPTAHSLSPSPTSSLDSNLIDPTLVPSLPERASKSSRAASSPIKQPLTYGAKSKSTVPPAAAMRTAKEEWRLKKARYQKWDAKSAVAETTRAGWKANTETNMRLPESNARGCMTDPPESQQSSHRPPLRDNSANQPGYADDPFDPSKVRRAGSTLIPDIPSSAPNEGLLQLIFAGGGDQDDAMRATTEARLESEPWSRIPPDEPKKLRKNRKKNHHRRSHAKSCHDAPEMAALEALDAGMGVGVESSTRQKRKYSTSLWPDDNPRQLKIYRSRNGDGPGDLFHDTPAEERLHGFQPLSKYGDPAEHDRMRRLERDGLYVVREGKREKVTTTTGRRHRRVHHLDTPARLKMSRRGSAMVRVDEYVNKVSEHSKSSRAIRSLPSRSNIRKVKELPDYVVKPIKTISWEEYNAAYNDEKPFPVDQELINRTMADLRAQYFRSNGRNRLTSAAKRRDREARAEERRIEGMSDIEERIDTVTPSQRPIDTGFPKNMPTGRRIPKLHFTTRTPSPPLPVRSQKRKVTRLLQPECGEEEDDADWETAHRPDPIDVHSSDEDQPDEVIDGTASPSGTIHEPLIHRRTAARRPEAPITRAPPGPASSQVKLPLPGHLPMRLAATGTRQKRNSTDSEDLQSLGRFMEQQLGPELDEIVARHPNIEEEVAAMRARTTQTRDEIVDEDFPSVPSAPYVPNPAQEAAGAGSKMLTGTGMTDHLLEALQQTKAMFAAQSKEADSHSSRSARNDYRRRRVAGKHELLSGTARSKGKGRRPGERPWETDQSQLRLDFSLQAAQPGSRTDNQAIEGVDIQEKIHASENAAQLRLSQPARQLPAADSTQYHLPEPTQQVRWPSMRDQFQPDNSAQYERRHVATHTDVITAENVAAAAPATVQPRTQAAPLADFPRSTPRLGLSRTHTRGSLYPRTPLLPKTLVDRPAHMLRSQFKPPTQAVPTPISPRDEPTQFPRTPYAHAPTPEYQAGQRMPSPTQATTLATRTQAIRSRSCWISAARVSTTERDSSPFDPFSSAVTVNIGDIQASEAYASYSDIYDHPGPSRVSSPATLGGMINPARLIRRQSFSKVMPKSSTLRRSTRTSGGRQDEGVNDSAGRLEQGYGGLAMNRIGSQRARRQFRPPTVSEPQRRR